MSTLRLLHHPVPPAPWHIVTERRDSLTPRGADLHTLYHGDTATEQRTGPHGLSLLSDIRDHLNSCGGRPTLPVSPPSQSIQPSLL